MNTYRIHVWLFLGRAKYRWIGFISFNETGRTIVGFILGFIISKWFDFFCSNLGIFILGNGPRPFKHLPTPNFELQGFLDC